MALMNLKITWSHNQPKMVTLSVINVYQLALPDTQAQTHRQDKICQRMVESY